LRKILFDNWLLQSFSLLDTRYSLLTIHYSLVYNNPHPSIRPSQSRARLSLDDGLNSTIMFILLLDKIANSNVLMGVAVVMEIVSVYVMKGHIEAMEQYGGALDLQFAYSPQELATWIENAGPEGCARYQQMASWDLFPYMESYALLLGALLLQQTRAAGLSDTIAMIFPLVMIMDIAETAIPAFGCRIYPDKLDSIFLNISSAANRYKWVAFGTGLLLLSILFVYNTIFPAPQQQQQEQPDLVGGGAEIKEAAVKVQPPKKKESKKKK
jgi:hypothetical protein